MEQEIVFEDPQKIAATTSLMLSRTDRAVALTLRKAEHLHSDDFLEVLQQSVNKHTKGALDCWSERRMLIYCVSV